MYNENPGRFLENYKASSVPWWVINVKVGGGGGGGYQ